MFESGNTSPVSIATISALLTGLSATLLSLIIGISWELSVIYGCALLLLVFFVVRFLVEKFIHKKIKLIYKFIHQTKVSKREEYFLKNVLPQQSIKEVGEEVLQWADQRKNEMEVLEKNEAFRKEFLQNLSHEFKTPAFAIQGYLETLIAGASEQPEIRKRFLENAFKNTERLINLISDLDEITKLESGKLALHHQNFVIQDLIIDVYEALQIKSAGKKINCLIKKGCEQPITVYADKEKIRQVLINLVENAIKYGNADGIGIAEEHLSRIFERFFRTDYGRSRNIGGSGLGLAICKHIVEAHGHFIQVRSKPGIGTTFGFTLNKYKE